MSARVEIGQFAIKVTIVSAAIILTFGALLLIVDRVAEARLVQLRATFEASSKIGGRQFWSKVEQELEKQADPKSDLSPEKKQKLLAEIRLLADRWRPFIQAAFPAVPGDTKELSK